MFRANRRTATKVRDGRVLKKNRWAVTPTYFNTEQVHVVIDREAAGPGYRHLVRKEHIRRFINFLPDWKELSVGLNAIVLARGQPGSDGWHTKGVVGLCAWERELWRVVGQGYYQDHADLLSRLRVPIHDRHAEFTEATARACQLLHILLHEFGHHHDRMSTRAKRRTSRGEGFAEDYAAKYEALIWNRYLDEFGIE
jgi:hypothetical protein